MPVVHELRGIGRNMHDDYVARVSHQSKRTETANERSSGLHLVGEVMRWIFTGKGMLSYNPSIVADLVKVLEESATLGVQVTFAPGSFKGGQIGEVEETPALSARAWQMGPLSAATSKPNRTGPVICRRSTRAICRKRATGGRAVDRKMRLYTIE